MGQKTSNTWKNKQERHFLRLKNQCYTMGRGHWGIGGVEKGIGKGEERSISINSFPIHTTIPEEAPR
jgi:hypothetical protein